MRGCWLLFHLNEIKDAGGKKIFSFDIHFNQCPENQIQRIELT